MLVYLYNNIMMISRTTLMSSSIFVINDTRKDEKGSLFEAEVRHSAAKVLVIFCSYVRSL